LSSGNTGPQLRSLEALRGFLAVYVLIGHARWLLWAGHAAWLADASVAWAWPLAYAGALFRFGHEAVLVFFGLSGFFIHLSAASHQRSFTDRAVPAAAFYKRRAWRLVPPYLFALMVTIVCDAAGRYWFPMLYASQTGDALLDATFRRTGYDAASIVPALALLPSTFGRDFGTNGPLWSLAYEVVYYAAYPAWSWLRARSAPMAMIAVPVGCVLLAPYLPGFLSDIVRLYPLWIFGAALAEHVTRSRPLPAIGVACVGLAGCAGYLAAGQWRGHVVFASMFVAATVYLAATWRGSEDAAPHRLLQYLGRRSYSIYVVHFPFLVLMSAMVFQSAGQRPMPGWLAPGGAALAVAFGCVCFWICERHFLRRPSLS
jgi:peptidoglycan/LPS O-acetylase OafA/YrhL